MVAPEDGVTVASETAGAGVGVPAVAYGGGVAVPGAWGGRGAETGPGAGVGVCSRSRAAPEWFQEPSALSQDRWPPDPSQDRLPDLSQEGSPGLSQDASPDCSHAPFGFSASSSSTACRPSSAMSAPGSHGSWPSSSDAVYAMSCSGVGRCAGSLARQAATRLCSPYGSPVRSGSSWAMRYISACTPLSDVPKGSRPVAANISTEPRQKTSLAGVTGRPRTCSGDMKPGEPTAWLVRVRPPPTVTASSARAMPKSMTLGPSMVSRMLDGLRSRCTMPAAWMLRSAPASPPARIRTERSGSGVRPSVITCRSEGPAM